MLNGRIMRIGDPPLLIGAGSAARTIQAQANQGPSNEVGDRTRVLVVDDNPGIAQMLGWALELNGYVPTSITGAGALETWLKDIGSYVENSIVLLDISMPLQEALAFLE